MRKKYWALFITALVFIAIAILAVVFLKLPTSEEPLRTNGYSEANISEPKGNSGTKSVKLVQVGTGEYRLTDHLIGGGLPGKVRLQQIVRSGTRVISLLLRDDEKFDEKAFVEKLGGTFIRFPLNGVDLKRVSYRKSLYKFYDTQLARPGTAFIHCCSSNRVGASWALYLAEQRGLPTKDAISKGRDAGMAGLEPLVLEILGSTAPEKAKDDKKENYNEEENNDDDDWDDDWEAC